MIHPTDTIAAIATPPGRGGISVIRVSGKNVLSIIKALLKKTPPPRYALYSPFLDADGTAIDVGLAFYFPNPHSFTGEDVLELQGHGGSIVAEALLNRVIQLGARLARPGEFSERAFLNDKLDLTQAEAIADLIDASTKQAAKAAMRSLQGEFSQKIQKLVESVIYLRMYVEAAIDFPEEEIDFLSDGKVKSQLIEIIEQLEKIKGAAKQGVLLREGYAVAIVGKPNAGKSSLLNCLSGRESAIVTAIAGTTRDVLREHIHIDGIPLHIVDTAGLRESDDPIEQEGIRRAWAEVAKADHVLLIVDGQKTPVEQLPALIQEFSTTLPKKIKLTVIRNKIDLMEETPTHGEEQGAIRIGLSAKTGVGIDLLRAHLKASIKGEAVVEGNFIARRRHLIALDDAHLLLLKGYQQLEEHRAFELLADDLCEAQRALSQITGEFTTDDLLGKIFSTFCVGK